LSSNTFLFNKKKKIREKDCCHKWHKIRQTTPQHTKIIQANEKKKEKVNNCFLVVFKKIKILKKNQLKKQNKQNKN